MKKALVLLLALLIVLSAVTGTALARNHHGIRFEFGEAFHGQHDKAETPTDLPRETPTDRPAQDDEHRHEQDKEHQKPQKPQKPDTATDVVTDTDAQTATDVKEDGVCDSIFDAVVALKKHGHHGKDFRIPLNDDVIKLMEMWIEDAKVYFGFVLREDGEQQEIAMDDITAAPQEMKFITLGDNDADGAVTAGDALNILKHIVNKAPMKHEGRQILSDMNEDDVVAADDALCVLKKVVGKSF